ncbi:hypothetical protein DYB32_007094 [Aphanomyces invadans]|uniref:Uncharacterized protein n=1 Tax=Aphanomyces invadans TaxID=157072 RepID=A0A3R6WII8_9STRA|nr:hypothetical protein DYB32_007094 [Aphanomyces invadans]
MPTRSIATGTSRSAISVHAIFREQRSHCVAIGGGFLQVEIEDGHRAAFHGYCPRHATQEFCLDDVVTKLVASDLISDVKIARAIEKLPTSTPDPDEQLAALGKWLVKYAEQSMASMPSLQLLQILVDHLPQIYKTYPSTTIQLHDLLGYVTFSPRKTSFDTFFLFVRQFLADSNCFDCCSGAWIEKLHATFGRHADDPFDYCAVCEEPLTHLDHGFYCTNSHRPHMQHWSCQTKPVVVAASRPSKKKVKSTRLSKPPTPSSLIAEGRAAAAAIARRPPTRDSWPEAVAMLCGVCSLPMDHRAVAVSKSGGFHVLPIVETTAVYANQGQFMNDLASNDKAAAKAATNALPPTDRFRVQRGIRLVKEIQALLRHATTYQATQDDAVYSEMCTQLTGIIDWVKPLDGYAGEKLTQVHAMLVSKRGPGMAVLKQLVRDYTKLLHTKHVRAVDKAVQDQRKREMESVLESERVAREQVEAESERARKADLQRARKRERERERKRQKLLAAAATSAPSTPAATPPSATPGPPVKR